MRCALDLPMFRRFLNGNKCLSENFPENGTLRQTPIIKFGNVVSTQSGWSWNSFPFYSLLFSWTHMERPILQSPPPPNPYDPVDPPMSYMR